MIPFRLLIRKTVWRAVQGREIMGDEGTRMIEQSTTVWLCDKRTMVTYLDEYERAERCRCYLVDGRGRKEGKRGKEGKMRDCCALYTLVIGFIHILLSHAIQVFSGSGIPAKAEFSLFAPVLSPISRTFVCIYKYE